jgi:hypothetical protein
MRQAEKHENKMKQTEQVVRLSGNKVVLIDIRVTYLPLAHINYVYNMQHSVPFITQLQTNSRTEYVNKKSKQVNCFIQKLPLAFTYPLTSLRETNAMSW